MGTAQLAGAGSNTEVSLLYRDASNYKQHRSFVVSGALDEASAARVRAALDQGQWLVVPQLSERLAVELPDPRAAMLEEFSLSEDDHCWVELDGLALTDASPTVGVSAPQLLAAVVACAEEGWNDVNPYGD